MPRSIDRAKLERQVQQLRKEALRSKVGAKARDVVSSALRAKIGTERARQEAPYLFQGRRIPPQRPVGVAPKGRFMARGGHAKKRSYFSPY